MCRVFTDVQTLASATSHTGVVRGCEFIVGPRSLCVLLRVMMTMHVKYPDAGT